ncbi:hypothetical protein MNBD_GAMMA17-1059 [hydrothermal vent metagenome]|uniref:Uncharacterized protein n=1 Tax=hydrothermal vent metagenome TaxID=652676 RepID=A0A3B0ZD20_9ZZZZ
MAVKGSRPVVVKHHHPLKKSLCYVAVVLALLVGGWLLFDYGLSRAGFDRAQASEERDQLRNRIQQLEAEVTTLSAQKAVHKHAREIDRHAYDQVDNLLKAQQSKVLELKEEVIFYRGIVGSSDQVRGLQILSFRLESNGGERNYRYRLIINQLEKSNRVIKGRVKLSIIGLQGDEQVELSHAKVTKREAVGELFRFKYFQELDGDIVLPEGFVPLRIKVKAKSSGKKPKSIERIYSWSELVS